MANSAFPMRKRPRTIALIGLVTALGLTACAAANTRGWHDDSMSSEQQSLAARLRAIENRLDEIERVLGVTGGSAAQLYRNPQPATAVDQFNSSGPDHDPELISLLRNDKVIAAVKRVRDQTGWSLRDAKQYVDDVQRLLGLG